MGHQPVLFSMERFERLPGAICYLDRSFPLILGSRDRLHFDHLCCHPVPYP